MGQFLYRWLFIDLWVPVWPNIAAILPCGILGILWLDAKNEVRHLEQLKEMKRK